MLNKLIGLLFVLTLVSAPAFAGLGFAGPGSTGSGFAGDDVPPWFRQAALASVPTYDKKVPAVVLLDESRMTIGEDGRTTKVNYYAVRILTRDGREAAHAFMPYRTDSGKVRDIRAWMIRPSGEIKKYGKDDILDVARVDNDVYNEARAKVISARDDVEPGAVFGYEYTEEDRSIFTQDDWSFQNRLPVILSRLTVALPEGWRAESVTFNHAKIEPTVTGSTYSWSLGNLPFIEEEPSAPPVTNIAPRLAISFYAAEGKEAKLGRSFQSWKDVSRWLSELSDPQMIVNDEMTAKARQLTENARTEFERIRAIGRFAQSVNYCSIQIGVGRGGGYRPHSSADVFAKSYGDCKDKANLMRAMLKAINIPAYLVSIFAGDPTYVRQEWASPQQFNHVIIAIKVSDETQAPTIVEHPALGRLLIFDPTDDDTPLGDLPDHEQGSLALVIAGEQGALLRMPTTPPESNMLERQTEVVLASDGSITAKVREMSTGQAAVAERGAFRHLSRPEYQKMIEKWITRGANGASLSKVDPADNRAEGSFTLNVEFAARYGQLMQERLLVFKPAIVSRRESLSLTESSRKHPVVLESKAYTETARIKLPEGFEVDEMPDAVKLNAPFGSYTTSYEVKDGYLHFKRSLIVRGETITVDHYAEVRDFFVAIRAAEQAPVVLARK